MKAEQERERAEREKKERVAAEAKIKADEQKKEKKRQEEHQARMSLSKKTAGFEEDFIQNKGRVKVDKQIRKAKQRKDSLDDHSSNSSSEDEAPRRRGRQTK